MIAWRIQLITRAGRAYPEVSCAVVFEPRAWPALRERVRSLAQLGGFFARQGDGVPGIQAIWQGSQRLHEFIYAVDIHRTVTAL